MANNLEIALYRAPFSLCHMVELVRIIVRGFQSSAHNGILFHISLYPEPFSLIRIRTLGKCASNFQYFYTILHSTVLSDIYTVFPPDPTYFLCLCNYSVFFTVYKFHCCSLAVHSGCAIRELATDVYRHCRRNAVFG